MYRDVLYAVSAWMRRNGDVQGWQKIAGKFVPDIFNRLYPYSHPAFSALPPSMAVGCPCMPTLSAAIDRPGFHGLVARKEGERRGGER